MYLSTGSMSTVRDSLEFPFPSKLAAPPPHASQPVLIQEGQKYFISKERQNY